MARLRDLFGDFFDTLVRENRVLPPLAALLALLLFAWVVAGALVNEEEPSGGRAALVQSRDPAPAPEVEDRDADSYAAYRNKDPFRQLLAPAESTAEDTTGGTTTPEGTTPETTIPGDTTASVPPGDTGTGGQTTRRDSDGDGIPNRLEERLGLDPRNPDSDGDGIQDGDDDADGNGVPDGQQGGGAGSGGGGGGNAGGGNADGGAGSGGELFDSGGYVP